MTDQPSSASRDRDGRPSRRAVLRHAAAAFGTAGLASVAGCAALTGAVTFEATAATVPPATLDETGYEQTDVSRPVAERTYEAGGQSKTVEVTNVVAEYARVIDLSTVGLGAYRAAVFAALSTPQVEVLGRTFNPVGDMTTDELAASVQEQYEGVTLGEQDRAWTGDVAGVETTVARFQGTAELAAAGTGLDVYVHISEAVAVGGDFVVALGAYPRLLDESSELATMATALQHG